MTRDISAAAITESLKSFGAMPVWFVVLNLDSGTERFWSGRGDFSWGGDTYEGTGDLGAIGNFEESTTRQGLDLTMALSGVPQDRVDRAMDQDVIGRVAEIFRGWLDADEQLVADPDLWWRGRLNSMHIELGETASIETTGVERLVDWTGSAFSASPTTTSSAAFPAITASNSPPKPRPRRSSGAACSLAAKVAGAVSDKRSNISNKQRRGISGGTK